MFTDTPQSKSATPKPNAMSANTDRADATRRQKSSVSTKIPATATTPAPHRIAANRPPDAGSKPPPALAVHLGSSPLNPKILGLSPGQLRVIKRCGVHE
jgi:hypothetical protein